MSRGLRLGLLTVAVCGTTACGPAPRAKGTHGDTVLMAQRQQRLERALARRDSVSPDAPLARWSMPPYLQEISGLTLTADGRLLTHNDQRGKVFEIDYRRGVVVKEFTLGKSAVHGDFEAITRVGDTLYLMASDAVLYAFQEGDNNHAVEYRMTDTGLGSECEFESLAYDPAIKSLLLACKHVHDKTLKDSLVIFRWSLDNPTANKKPSYLAIPLKKIIGTNEWNGVHPSDMTIDPFTGNYVILASREQALIDVTPNGEVVFARPLPPGHEQAEGVAITRDSLLLVSDEAKGGPALLTVYRWH